MILCFSRTQKMNLIDWGEVNWCESCNKWHNLGFWTWRKTEWRKLPSRPFLNVELKYTQPAIVTQPQGAAKLWPWRTKWGQREKHWVIWHHDVKMFITTLCFPDWLLWWFGSCVLLWTHMYDKCQCEGTVQTSWDFESIYILECVGTMTPHLHI
jgi:hypothetical protein